jgi:sulfate permease, SulP family
MIPLAALASVLIIVAYNMSEWREFLGLFRSPKSDVIVMLLVFLVTVLIDLVKAIEIGMILASFLFMKRMADVSNVNIIKMDASEEGEERYNFVEENKKLECPNYIQIYEINGPFFFGAADKFVSALESLGHEKEVLIIRMRNVPSMDATALKAFKVILNNCKHKHIAMLITGINEQPLNALRKAGIYDFMGEYAFFNEIDEAVKFVANKKS